MKQALKSELACLAEKLASAIEDERFEEAAMLRDQICKIEEKKGVAES
jgi:protein-arginine kinase activator protein McsA